MRRRRTLLVVLTLGLGAGILWRYQSEVLGAGLRWYMSGTRDPARQREAVVGVHRMLLLAPPPEAAVPELFELVTALSSRLATGEVGFAWGAYLYTGYVRDMVRDRPDGTPARSGAEVAAEVERQVAFFRIRKRPDVDGVRVSDILGAGGDSYSLEEIESAAREGRELPLR